MNSLNTEQLQENSQEDADAYLIKKCIQGDRQSFQKLYRRHQQRVRSTMYQLCGASALDDLVQEVFLRAWKGLPNLRKTAQFSSWLYRISWNVATDQRRQFAQLQTQKETLSQNLTIHQDSSDLMLMHYQDLVQRGLEQLSEDHRDVIVLHDLEDLPQKEVANILGIPVGTVKSRLFNARESMRKYLQKQGVQL